ncbi:MAG: hypothetical protein V1804_00400 [Patescibacteria group bacterium]
MEFPSIKLNIFKKLEYFLILKELNNQFDVQFNALKNRKWLEKENKYEGTYPTWEAEKKVLFWTYAFHKRLKCGIRDKHFDDMFIKNREKEILDNRSGILGNLEMRGFAGCQEKEDKSEKIYRISKEGLAFGELLWYLYIPIDIDKDNFEIKILKKYYKLCEAIRKIRNGKNNFKLYFEVYETKHRLNRLSFGWLILYLQLFSYYSFIIYGIAFFSFEFIKLIGLLDDMQKGFSWLNHSPFSFSYLIFIILLPFIIFTLSLIADFFYSKFIIKKKIVKVERMMDENKSNNPKG